jgi:quercetin dioxygenase-like cupin family protein
MGVLFMRVFNKVVVLGFLLSALSSEVALGQLSNPPAGGGAPRPIAEKIVDTLPSDPLYWTVKSFPSLDDAKKAGGEFSLAAESDGRAWLFTLGPRAKPTQDGVNTIEAGPIAPPRASRFMLRISESITSPGRRTPVHTHPGSEAIYVLKGVIEIKTSDRTHTVSAGEASVGAPPNTVMQATTMGTENAHNLIMFVLDASKPPQAPATF